jgi:tetratricopeptide (TPR) repeat protein
MGPDRGAEMLYSGMRRERMWSPLSNVGGGEVTGAGIVRELPPELALHAWQAVRLVVLWAEAGRGSADGVLVAEGLGQYALELAGGRPQAAAADESLAPLLAIFLELSRPEPDAAGIARACLCASEWALPRRYLVTGLAFAEAAAFAMPSARYAFLAAKLHRQYGRHMDADRLLKVAEGLAKTEKDWETTIRVRLARGNVDLLHGRYEEAREVMVKALRTCERYRLKGAVLGEAHHDLLVAESGLREYTAAASHAEAAMGAYGPDHPRLPHLAHDLASVWLETGDYENALTVLQSLLQKHFQHDPLSRLMVCASAVRAAAGAGDTTAYAMLARELETALSHAKPVTVRHGPALVDAARGACMASDRVRRDRWTGLAVGFAEQMQQPNVIEEAGAVERDPGAPLTARSRIGRNQGLARKTVAALAESVPA